MTEVRAWTASSLLHRLREALSPSLSPLFWRLALAAVLAQGRALLAPVPDSGACFKDWQVSGPRRQVLSAVRECYYRRAGSNLGIQSRLTIVGATHCLDRIAVSTVASHATDLGSIPSQGTLSKTPRKSHFPFFIKRGDGIRVVFA